MQAKLKTILLAFTLIALLLPAYAVQAQEDDTYIPAEKTISGPVFLTGRLIKVDGTIDGDLYIAGQDIIVNGPVSGDIIAAGQHITINGPVAGDIRLAGQTIRLQGKVTGSATLACQDWRLEDDAEIGKDMVAFGNFGQTSGTVKRNLYGASDKLRDRITPFPGSAFALRTGDDYGSRYSPEHNRFNGLWHSHLSEQDCRGTIIEQLYSGKDKLQWS
ncbi:MAG: polymer-forming cytoskeletal protein [Bacillota bacterium]|nr:polymer-forming cytoskeletal protein [Bacillota bacterium]